MLASGKTPGMLCSIYLSAHPQNGYSFHRLQPSAIQGPQCSKTVLQSEIGKTLLAKSTAGSGHFIKYEPSIQNIWS